MAHSKNGKCWEEVATKKLANTLHTVPTVAVREAFQMVLLLQHQQQSPSVTRQIETVAQSIFASKCHS